jgi:hypothetical protein
MSDRRRGLPVITRGERRHGGRSDMTCQYRCGYAWDHPVPNRSDNKYLGDVITAGLSRPGLVRAGTLGALAVGGGRCRPRRRGRRRPRPATVTAPNEELMFPVSPRSKR